MFPVGANAGFRTGMLGRGFTNLSPSVTTSYWKYGQFGKSTITDPTRWVRPLGANITTLGWTLEILFEPDDLTSQQLFTNSQDFARYSGIDISMTNGMFINVGDGTGETGSDRMSSLSAATIEAGKVNHWIATLDSGTSENAWHQCMNGTVTTGQNGAGGTGNSLAFSGISLFDDTALCVLGRDFVTENFTGVLYGFNLFHHYFTPQELQDRHQRILDMFTPAVTRELQPTGFIELAGIGAAPQSQNLP